ncbi:MAG: FAD-binding protein [Candidatus Electrothrix sp. EH2]|nr:FAD-binding protein [Candidatus Electrothrix sp. EH2]
MISRRDFLRISAMASAAALVNWQCPAWARGGSARGDNYDVIIIGAGLGGLSCAAWLVQYGFKPLVLDQRDKVGGYATSFKRGHFTCEASLHGITGNPIYSDMACQLLGVSETELMSILVPHEYSWNALYRNELALDFPSGIPGGNSGIQQMREMLLPLFPEESMPLSRYMDDWESLLREIGLFYTNAPENGMPPLDVFFKSYPIWARMIGKTLAEHISECGIRNRKLRSILGQSWAYYGLPPSQLPAWVYLWATGSYHNYGKFYIRGTSQSLSDILAGVIMKAGGTILLDTEVKKIILDNGRAVGVQTEDNAYYGNAVVSNASVPQTFGRLLPESAVPSKYMEQITQYRPSISHVSVWLGLNQDISTDIHQSDLFIYPNYDPEKAYKAAMQCNPYGAGITMMNYDRLIKGFSPHGTSLISLLMPSGYRMWQRYEADYFSGDKRRYYKRKKHITRKMIRMAEQSVLPELSDMIIMQDSSTPLTNVRFTGNTEGAMYGFEQVRDNSGFKRLGNRVEAIPGLYLSGAWTNPGGGFELVMLSGKEAVKCMAEDWGMI